MAGWCRPWRWVSEPGSPTICMASRKAMAGLTIRISATSAKMRSTEWAASSPSRIRKRVASSTLTPLAIRLSAASSRE
ncbi:hypothetical protein D3C72_2307910 [compost metagenome]